MHQDVLRGGVDCTRRIERRTERRAACADVVRIAHRRNIGKAERSNGREDAGRDPCAARVDRAARCRSTARRPGIDDATPPRTTTVPPSIGALPSPNTSRALVMVTSCASAGAAESASAADAKCQEAASFHISFTGLAELEIAQPDGVLGSSASYISAPSIQTFSGRE